jgi:hypothetical protein
MNLLKRLSELILIIMVLFIMIWQNKKNYMEGWQNARYLAESILSNAWLFVWKCKPFMNKKASQSFIDLIKKLENEVNLHSFLSLVPNQESEISSWMNAFRKAKLDEKKGNYIKYRLNDQIKWYSKKAYLNQEESTRWYKIGLILMGIGAFLTLLIIIRILPNWSFLGFFTTAAASVFSWSKAKRSDELKITYSLAARELSRFKTKIELTTKEDELIKLVADIEKIISREHKLWAARI